MITQYKGRKAMVVFSKFSVALRMSVVTFDVCNDAKGLTMMFTKEGLCGDASKSRLHCYIDLLW